MNTTRESILPSKKIISVAVIALVAIVAVFIFTRPLKQSSTSDTKENAPNTANASAATQDSDDDGLKDWEESLWRTDADNPDTDGDGTEDGEEISQNRNPIKPYPDDALPRASAARAESAVSVSTTTEPLSGTAAISREIFAQVIALQQSGADFDEQTIRSISGPLAEYILPNTTKPILPAAFTTTDDERNETLRNYALLLGDIVERNSIPGTESELVIYNRALEGKNTEEMLKLKPIADGYRAMAREGMSVIVPRSALALHTDLMTSFLYIANGLDAMPRALKDGVEGIRGFSEYRKGATLLIETLVGFITYFNAKGIVFTQP